MSGVGLAGTQFPSGWQAVPAGYLFSRVKRTGFGDEQLLSVYRDYGVIPKSSRDDNFNKASEDLSAYQLVEANDLVINKMKAWQGSVGISAHRGIVSPAYFVATPTRAFSRRYVHYLLRCSDYLIEYQTRSAGIRVNQWDLDWDDFRRIPLVLPPTATQEHIANFLDEQTARIDALIAEKAQLGRSLEEFRLSAIHEALSVGLDREAPTVDTGDEWFARVPTHWAFCPLNYRYEVQLGKMLDEKRITGAHLLPYLRNTDVQWDRINSDSLPEMDIAPTEMPRYSVKAGDLLVCEGGEVGRAAIWEGPENAIGYQKALHRVRPRTANDVPRFLFYALFDSAKRGRFESRDKATIAHLTAEAFRRYRFTFPPYAEQTAIVQHLDFLTSKIDGLQSHCTEHVERLREYRASLISAAVTGQLDINSYKEAA